MKYKPTYATLTFALISVCSLTSFAGPSTSGGGFVVACPTTPVEAASVQLLDLYEGKHDLGFELAKASGSLTEDYLAGVKRTYALQGDPKLGDARRDDTLENLKEFFRSTKFVQTEAELPKSHDLGSHAEVPPACSLKQVAYFDDLTQTIVVLKSLWDQMDSVNQAALVTHEEAYRYYRILQESTSEQARRFVTHVYALQGLLPIKHQVPENAKSFLASFSDATHSSKISMFYATKMYGTSEILRLQFTQLMDRPLLAKTWVDLPFHLWNVKPQVSTSQPFHTACVVQDAGVNLNLTVPVQGTMTRDLELNYTYKTGEPIKFMLLQKGIVLGESFVTICD